MKESFIEEVFVEIKNLDTDPSSESLSDMAESLGKMKMKNAILNLIREKLDVLVSKEENHSQQNKMGASKTILVKRTDPTGSADTLVSGDEQ